MEYIKLLVFREKPAFLNDLAGREMNPSDSRLPPLFAPGKKGRPVDFAQAALLVTTCAAKDVVRSIP